MRKYGSHAGITLSLRLPLLAGKIDKTIALARILILGMAVATMGSAAATGQVPCGNTKLVCLIPTVLHTTSSTFNFFNSAFGTQIAQLPLPSRASGFLFTLDKSLGVYAVSQESFGPVLAERAETIGRHKAYLAFSYQRFAFSQIDNNDLKKLSILFYFPTVQNPQVVTNPNTRVDATINQYVLAGTFGITDRTDVSIAVPAARVSMGVSSTGTEYSTTSAAQATFSEFFAGAASGVGDVVLSAKNTVLQHERYAIAVGSEFRFPSGDEKNFLGSGAYGIEPYVVLSRRARVTPHVDLAYQWNSNSSLATGQDGKEKGLPGFFTYDAGADIGVTKHVTAIADLLGQVYFNAPQISSPRNVTAQVAGQPQTFSTVVQVTDSYNVDNLALGIKANPWRNLLLTANVALKLNNGGLRATAVPLASISYSF